MTAMAQTLLDEAAFLRDALKKLSYLEPVAFVYHPLDYAWEAHKQYVERFARETCEAVFLGMNPGPFGMAQTGVPFGEVASVRDWMGINVPVGQPERVHPKRPVEGFDCPRSEVSGRRLWGLFSEKHPQADAFFQKHFVLNYCPLLFVSATGSNVTPDKIAADVRKEVERLCDAHLKRVLEVLSPRWAVGVGGYAEARIEAVRGEDASWQTCRILHPSPASPAANRDWAGTATRQLLEAGVWSA